ncbi:MAG: EamA family transporter [Ilumatobacteraceae bacterium]
MGILLGAVASVLIGLADFFGRYGTRRANAVTATATMMLAGAFTTGAFFLFVESSWVARDVLLGAGSGAMIGFALALLYESMSISSAALAGPIVALGSSLIPLGWDLLLGNVPSAQAFAGAALAVAGIVVITFSPSLAATRGRGARLAAASAVLVGIAFILLGETTEESGVWSPFIQRVVAFVLLAGLAIHRRLPIIIARHLRPAMALSGFFGGLAILAFTAGTRRGSLGEVAVAASMYPVVTATLAAAFDDDHLNARQVAGIVAVIAGISLMALG